MSGRHTFNGTCVHAEDEVCPHYKEEMREIILDLEVKISQLEHHLEFYKAIHNAEAFNRLAAAAKERLDEYVDKYKKLKEADNAVQ